MVPKKGIFLGTVAQELAKEGCRSWDEIKVLLMSNFGRSETWLLTFNWTYCINREQSMRIRFSKTIQSQKSSIQYRRYLNHD